MPLSTAGWILSVLLLSVVSLSAAEEGGVLPLVSPFYRFWKRASSEIHQSRAGSQWTDVGALQSAIRFKPPAAVYRFSG